VAASKRSDLIHCYVTRKWQLETISGGTVALVATVMSMQDHHTMNPMIMVQVSTSAGDRSDPSHLMMTTEKLKGVSLN
jgi:hypothetical protein